MTWFSRIIYSSTCIEIMVVQVIEFSSGGIKLERFLPKNQHTQRKLLNLKNWCYREVSQSSLIWLSKSIFYDKNHRNIFLILGHICCYCHFLKLHHYTNPRNSIIFFGYVDFLGIFFSNFVQPFENSTTHLTIIERKTFSWVKCDEVQAKLTPV